MSTKYLVTIPDSAEWQESKRDLPYRRVTAKVLMFTLTLDLVREDDDDDDGELQWSPTIYDDTIDSDIFTNLDNMSWNEDDLEAAKENMCDEVRVILHNHLIDDLGAIEVVDDIGSLVLEN